MACEPFCSITEELDWYLDVPTALRSFPTAASLKSLFKCHLLKEAYAEHSTENCDPHCQPPNSTLLVFFLSRYRFQTHIIYLCFLFIAYCLSLPLEYKSSRFLSVSDSRHSLTQCLEHSGNISCWLELSQARHK